MQSDPIGILANVSDPAMIAAGISVDALGRWELNHLYSYVSNNPVNLWDFFGLRNQGDGRRSSGKRSNSKGKKTCMEKCYIDFAAGSMFTAGLIPAGSMFSAWAGITAKLSQRAMVRAQASAYFGNSGYSAVSWWDLSKCLKGCDEGQCE